MIDSRSVCIVLYFMQTDQELILVRDTDATVIPAGETQLLLAGTRAVISQALGGTVTIRTDSGLFRLSSKNWDALGAAAQEELDLVAQSSVSEALDAPFNEDLVWDAIRGCFDPEIPINIVDLGLIYDLQISDPEVDGKYKVNVKMTLTAQGCGMGPVIAEDAKNNIEALSSVSSAQVEIVWDPPWTPRMISEAGRKQLGLD